MISMSERVVVESSVKCRSVRGRDAILSAVQVVVDVLNEINSRGSLAHESDESVSCDWLMT